jgi:hypothetical protein
LPTLSRAKAKGKQAKCINRLKQLGIVFNYYVGNEDGFMVQDSSGSPANYWHQKFRSELGNHGAPTTTATYFEDPGMSGAFALDKDGPNPEGSHYMYNR